MAEFRFRDKSLTIDQRVTALLEELTLDEKLSLLSTFQPPVERLGLKGFGIGAEVARGLVGRDFSSTVFPEPFGLAATFDPDMMYRMGEITGIESRICHKQGKTSLCVWGPTVDAERDPRWGRTEEAYGEDPCLIGRMSAAYTRGMAGESTEQLRVLPMLKHFYANNHEENRATDNACIPIGLKHDYYLKAFETAFREGGAKGVMTSYNEINGVEGLCNPELSKILKKEWGMLFSVTDGGDFVQNVLCHHSDDDFTETAARVFKNHGADIMTDNGALVGAAALEAISRGLLSEEDIDSALFGVFKARFLLGEIDDNSPYDNYPEELLCSEDFYKVSEKAAEESVILLQNDGDLLPLDPGKKTFVAGIHANLNFRDWYVGLTDRKDTVLDGIRSRIGEDLVVYDSGNDIVALRDKKSGLFFSVQEEGTLLPTVAVMDDSCLFEMLEWGENQISLKSVKNGKFLTDEGAMKCAADEVFGWFVHEQIDLERREDGIVLRNWQKRFLAAEGDGHLAVSKSKRPENFVFEMEVYSKGEDRMKKLAAGAEQTVLFAGNHPLINAREGYDRRHLELPEKAKASLAALLEVNPRTVLFLVSGYPYALHEPGLSAVMHIAHAGPAMGTAVARTLFGDVSPAGRCPMTWYRSEKELCDLKDYNIIGTKSTYLYYTGKPLFPFGHGLSYAEFVYSGLSINGGRFGRGDKIQVSFEIRNEGRMDSDEIPQLYVVPPRFNGATPLRQLKAFRRVGIPKGESVNITLELAAENLAFWDVSEGRPEVYGGSYRLLIGRSSEDIRLETTITVDGKEYTGLDVSKSVPGAASYDYMGVVFDTNKALTEYALLEDWQSFLSFHDCDMQDFNRVEVNAATWGDRSVLKLNMEGCGDGGASFEIPSTGGYDRFVTVSAEITPVQGRKTLTFTTDGTTALKSFRFYRGEER